MTGLLGVPVLISAASVAWTSGVPGLAYLVFWLAVCAPGVPFGMRALGRNAAGLVGGAALGYVVTSLAWWAVIAAHVPSRGAFLAAGATGAGLLLVLAWGWRQPPVLSHPWARRDTVAFSIVLILVPVLMTAPYRNLGYQDAEGRRYYRAYFTADFVWHMALTAEVSRFEMPLRNPYLADRALTYYWTYFVVPGTITEVGPVDAVDAEVALKVNAVGTAVLLLGAFYAFAATATRRRTAAVLGVALVVLASSAEGLAALEDLWSRGRSFEAVRYLNIDAVASWWYDGLRIDGVHRTMFYTPQHGLSCALGLIAAVIAAARGVGLPFSGVLLAGVFLGGATLLNPFLGAAFCAVYGLAVVADAVVTRSSWRALFPHALAAILPVLAAWWGVWNGMSEGAGEALTLAWAGHARKAPVVTFLLSLGPVILPALVGLFPGRTPGQPARTAAAGLLVGLFLFYFVMLSDQYWVGFRAGQVLLAMTTVPLARVFDQLITRKGMAAGGALAIVILVVGLPTTAIDTYNAADIGNTRMGAGFPWTVTLSPAEREALAWVRRATPRISRVQAEPIVRGRAHWSLIPSFAERRMSAGLPISLLPQPEYGRRSERVRAMFSAPSSGEAYALARELRIDYVWVDATDRAKYPDGVRRFEEDPTRFVPVFRNADVSVYGVR